jgi:Flp pilus assembly protein TadG
MRNSAEKQQGFVLVVVAIVLIVLVGFVALGVDTGALYSARTAAQEAADAGALAGAFTFIITPTAPQPVAHAKAAAMANTILGDPILVGDVTVVVDAPNKRVTVTVQKTQQTFFAKALGIGNALISVTAKAEAGSHATSTPNPKPFFLPNTIPSAMDPCDACTAGEFMIDPATGDVTTYGLSAFGQKVLIKPHDPGQALKPSLYYLIDFTGSGGGATELHDWITGTEPVPPVACGSVLEVEKGNKAGPIDDAVDDLVGDPPDDVFVPGTPPHYLINGTTPSDTSKALVTVPIWDTCGSGFCAGGIPIVNGFHQIAVLGYALVFLEGQDKNNDPLRAWIINVVGCAPAAGGGGGGPAGSSAYGFPLRLVRVP